MNFTAVTECSTIENPKTTKIYWVYKTSPLGNVSSSVFMMNEWWTTKLPVVISFEPESFKNPSFQCLPVKPQVTLSFSYTFYISMFHLKTLYPDDLIERTLRCLDRFLSLNQVVWNKEFLLEYNLC